MVVKLKKTEKWFYDGNIINIVPYYKYLRVYLTSKLSWSKTHKMLSLHAKKSIHYILRLRKEFGFFQLSDLFKILTPL